MAKIVEPKPDRFIHPLHINGLTGRMLVLPPKRGQTREILVIYGHHSSLERWWGLAQVMNDFGGVYMPDLPGFGGMDSFYKIGSKANLDTYADYLASLVQMRYKRRKVTIVGISFGFLVATRMLQRYPELTSKVEMLVSAAGFMRYDDFHLPKSLYNAFLGTAWLLHFRPMTFFYSHTAMTAPVIRAAYARTPNAKHKFGLANGNKDAFNKMMDMEVSLWKNNDARTYMDTTLQILRVDNCNVPIDLPVWHIHTDDDHYFDNAVVEQHMRVVFNDFYPLKIDAKTHVPSVIATKQESYSLVPKELQYLLKPAQIAKQKANKTSSKKQSRAK